MNINIAREMNGGGSMSDLKKMYSSHVLENVTLSRQKSELDFAKAKRLQEINHSENMFLRKYSKYINQRSNLRRRCSIDAGDLRNFESRASSRPQSQGIPNVSQRLRRDSVISECPYSLETWSKLVDNETDFMKQQKKDILFGEKKDNESSEVETDQDRLLRRREMPRSILKSEDNEIDHELTNLQKVKARGRRHSVTLGALPVSAKTKTNDIKLPIIKEDSAPARTRRTSLSQPDLISTCEKIELIKPCVTFAMDKPKLRKGRRFSAADIRHVSFSDNIPLKHITDVKDTFVKPVANAVVIVRDDKKTKTKQEDKSVDTQSGEVVTPRDIDIACEIVQPREIEVLPTIPQSPDINNENSLDDNTKDLRESLQTPVDVIPPISTPTGHRRRKGSFSKAALECLIQTHHGAAKLRYIAKLAYEMEKDELAKLNNNSEQDVYAELANCRYLRRSKTQDSEIETLL